MQQQAFCNLLRSSPSKTSQHTNLSRSISFDRQSGCAAHQVAARFDQYDEANGAADELKIASPTAAA
jgi:hypothetical protein